jgi:methylmalonyl-CoA mutase
VTTRPPAPYKPQHPVRIVTAASLFDGHDAAINVMRRLIQATGAEVIHLGHNRSVSEIVECALQEDAQGIAVTSYQGGHLEFFRYMRDLLDEAARSSPDGTAPRVHVFGGGGGTILPSEIEALHAYGIDRIYSPDDGRAMGLQGMIDDLVARCDHAQRTPPASPALTERLLAGDPRAVAAAITLVENHAEALGDFRARVAEAAAARGTAPVLGITGTGGSGKSSLVDELVRRFLADLPELRIAILSVDPTKRRSGGALLGDRIRMNAASDARVYMRSLATRQAHASLSAAIRDVIAIVKAAGYGLVIVESSGIGQSDSEIVDVCDASLYVMTSEYGAATQLEKIDMLDFADLVAINKFDKRGSLDALRDVRKQWRRNHQAFDAAEDAIPVLPSIASQFNDPGTNRLFARLLELLGRKLGVSWAADPERPVGDPGQAMVIPPERSRYLAEIAESNERYDQRVADQSGLARRWWQMAGAANTAGEARGEALARELTAVASELEATLDHDVRALLDAWPAKVAKYRDTALRFEVRGKTIEQSLITTSLSGLPIPKVAVPGFEDKGEIVRWVMQENVPGEFPYTAGVFPLKRVGEDPARMFAGEGGPERTNRRFHYLSSGMPAKRLSTAFDSVTLYGEDPDRRPDIWGKIGNSGVSVCSLDDAKRLYSGFDLSDPSTSVSMTINGPAPMLLAFFLNAAIDQRCETWIRSQGLEGEARAKISALYAARGMPSPTYRGELPPGNDGLGLMLLGASGDEVLPRETYERIAADTVKVVRGTVQADILKEDQAQNTCIFSTEFALKLMGDIQEWFVHQDVRNFYSVSISGYHIAEAGANPITQLAFTLANGFTYVEYYLARGMKIDDFAPNLSFFFSNGLDPEYSVIGRVARRLWAKAIKYKYGGDDRSQKLKYHIQTSGRSLHAQEIAFNDIRTTLQALYALYDNCNSLHTNAYDEAITTPTEESVRRALAIQLIINKELGLNQNENPLQGSFIIERLTDMVEAAVLKEFRALSERGGVLGAMERMYQRGKIQDESLHYETLKHDGRMPIIGVNTFLDAKGSPTIIPPEVIRSTEGEKQAQLDGCLAVQRRDEARSGAMLRQLRSAASRRENLFAVLVEAAKVCTLGQMSRVLYEVGGQYRRNM